MLLFFQNSKWKELTEIFNIQEFFFFLPEEINFLLRALSYKTNQLEFFSSTCWEEQERC